MNIEDVEARFDNAYKQWVLALRSEHGLNGKLDDTELRQVVSDTTGASYYRELPVLEHEKCLVKRMWDEYVKARDTLSTFYRSMNV